MTSLRSTAASSGVRRSSSPELCGGTSRPRGWRWPTGASPIMRVSCADEESPAAVPVDAVDDLASPTVCAIAPWPPRKANIVTILITFRMSISPEMRASRLCDATDMLLVALTLKRRDYEGMLWRRETLTNVTWTLVRSRNGYQEPASLQHTAAQLIRKARIAETHGKGGEVLLPAKHRQISQRGGTQIGITFEYS